MGKRTLSESGEISYRIDNLLAHFGVGPRILSLMLQVPELSVRFARIGKGGKRMGKLKRFQKLEEIAKKTQGVLIQKMCKEWYRTKNECLGNLTPIDCILNFGDKGMDRVVCILNELRYGNHA